MTSFPALALQRLGSAILREPAQPVRPDQEGIATLANEMLAFMQEADGIGLAAPQVGIGLRLIVVGSTPGHEAPLRLLNPRVTWSSFEHEVVVEGCLSIPDVRAPVSRPARVRVEAFTPEWDPVTLEADGYLARVLQHEIDHLDGVLYIDHLSSMQRDALLKKYRSLQRKARR